MYIRCAFFEGRVKPGCDDAFASFRERTPSATVDPRFPGPRKCASCASASPILKSPTMPWCSPSNIPSLEAIEQAMQSDVRMQSRAVTGELVKMFEGRIFHTIFDAPHDVVLG